MSSSQNQCNLKLFIQKNIGYSMDHKFLRDSKYWDSFFKELKIIINDTRSSQNVETMTIILNAPYALKKNKNKSKSGFMKQPKIKENTKTVSFFHFLCQDMCNYWPLLHDKHFNSTWNIIKLILQNGAEPLIKYNEGIQPIYSYQSILLLLDAFGRYYTDNINKILHQILFVLSSIKYYHYHPPIFTFYGDPKLNTNWLYLGCSIQNKPKQYILNALSPIIITFLLKHNHTLFEFREIETDKIVDDDYSEYIHNIDMNVIQSYDPSIIILLCFINFILPQIHNDLFDTIYQSFISSKNTILNCISKDVLSVIIGYILYGYKDYTNSKNKLLPFIPQNINEDELMKYVLQKAINGLNNSWWKWISETILPQLTFSQITQFRDYTSSDHILCNEWNQFFINHNGSFNVVKLLSIYGGILRPIAIHHLLQSNFQNLENLQIILSTNYEFVNTWRNPRLFIEILENKELQQTNVLFICRHICEHLEPKFNFMRSVFKRLNTSSLENHTLMVILSDPKCVKLKHNVSANFSYLYKNRHNVLLYLVKYDLLDFEHCVKNGDLINVIEIRPRDYKASELTEKFEPVWMWIKQKYKECNDNELKDEIQKQVSSNRYNKNAFLHSLFF